MKSYIYSILVIILLSLFVDLIVDKNSKNLKYIKMTISLIFIYILLNPVIVFLKQDEQNLDNYFNSIEINSSYKEDVKNNYNQSIIDTLNKKIYELGYKDFKIVIFNNIDNIYIIEKVNVHIINQEYDEEEIIKVIKEYLGEIEVVIYG